MNDLGRMYHTYHLREGKYGFAHHLTTKGRFFRSEVGEGRCVLDLGSRDGTLTRTFARGNSVVCVDVDEYAASICRRFGLTSVCADLNACLPFAGQSFDVVVLADVLEHVLLGRELLEEIQRLLVPGGLFLGSTPNAFYWSNRVKMFCGKDPHEFLDPTHVRHFSLDSLRLTLSGCFADLRIVPYGHHSLARTLPKLFASDFFWLCRK
ncbi:MAG: class I SAM-dependent methyltransferase [Pseudomonadota bacterium]